MNIDISKIDLNSFNLKEGIINNNQVILINPKDFDCKWDKYNLNLRSLVIDKNGKILSHSLKKFFNYLEKPDLYPNPDKAKDGILVDKIDGSLCVCDWIDGFSCRTRGTLSYKTLENAPDFDYVLKKYPNLENIVRANPDYTYLLEIVTPNQKIVLDYGSEPDLFYLGCIHKDTGLYTPFFADTDNMVKQIGCKIPEIYNLKGNLLEIYNQIKEWRGKEGGVLVFNDNRNMVKLKCTEYLNLHKFKSYATLENTIDLFFEYGRPSFNDFQIRLKQNFDEDCASLVLGFCSVIVDAFKEVNKIIEGFQNFIDKRKDYSRKDLAMDVLKSYGDTNRASFVFTLKDKSALGDEPLKKLLWQILKK